MIVLRSQIKQVKWHSSVAKLEKNKIAKRKTQQKPKEYTIEKIEDHKYEAETKKNCFYVVWKG